MTFNNLILNDIILFFVFGLFFVFNNKYIASLTVKSKKSLWNAYNKDSNETLDQAYAETSFKIIGTVFIVVSIWNVFKMI